MAKIKRVTYFAANVEDRPGALLKIMKDLKAKNIGLTGLWGFGTTPGNAQVFVVAKSPDKLRNTWKASNLLAEEGTGFLITGTDRTGVLVGTLEALAGAGINIHTIDAIAVGARFGSFVCVNATDVQRASQALGAK